MALAAAAVLGGCCDDDGPGKPAPAEIRAEGYDCGFTGPATAVVWDVDPEAGTVPPAFDPVEAVWCKLEDGPLDSAGVPSVIVNEHRSVHVAPLIKRFATPDTELEDGVTCDTAWSLDLIPPRVWLLDAEGRAVLGHSPWGICAPDPAGLEQAFPDAR